jgi:hypothetical protein
VRCALFAFLEDFMPIHTTRWHGASRITAAARAAGAVIASGVAR